MAYGTTAPAAARPAHSARLGLLALAALGLTAFACTAKYGFGAAGRVEKQSTADGGAADTMLQYYEEAIAAGDTPALADADKGYASWLRQQREKADQGAGQEATEGGAWWKLFGCTLGENLWTEIDYAKKSDRRIEEMSRIFDAGKREVHEAWKRGSEMTIAEQEKWDRDARQAHIESEARGWENAQVNRQAGYDSCLKANEDVDPCNVGGNVPQSGMFKGLKAGRVLADKGNINFHASTAGSANVHSG